ncbi:hypothetical protein [Rhizobium rhizogenes]|uniref:hypothetical protein n=1 Tax=Rhizobium rhizogenes TaxID=359 RepID=UPI001F3FA0C4|nr:hypothetical protein [Rhizobium rhizogenes]
MGVHVVAFGVGVFLVGVGTAHAYCSEPSAPYCVSSYGKFDDQSDFEQCKREVESYKSEIEDFVRCEERDVDEANDAAKKAASEAEDALRTAKNAVNEQYSNYNDAVNNFNNRANSN